MTHETVSASWRHAPNFQALYARVQRLAVENPEMWITAKSPLLFDADLYLCCKTPNNLVIAIEWSVREQFALDIDVEIMRDCLMRDACNAYDLTRLEIWSQEMLPRIDKTCEIHAQLISKRIPFAEKH